MITKILQYNYIVYTLLFLVIQLYLVSMFDNEIRFVVVFGALIQGIFLFTINKAVNAKNLIQVTATQMSFCAVVYILLSLFAFVLSDPIRIFVIFLATNTAWFIYVLQVFKLYKSPKQIVTKYPSSLSQQAMLVLLVYTVIIIGFINLASSTVLQPDYLPKTPSSDAVPRILGIVTDCSALPFKDKVLQDMQTLLQTTIADKQDVKLIKINDTKYRSELGRSFGVVTLVNPAFGFVPGCSDKVYLKLRVCSASDIQINELLPKKYRFGPYIITDIFDPICNSDAPTGE